MSYRHRHHGALLDHGLTRPLISHCMRDISVMARLHLSSDPREAIWSAAALCRFRTAAQRTVRSRGDFPHTGEPSSALLRTPPPALSTKRQRAAALQIAFRPAAASDARLPGNDSRSHDSLPGLPRCGSTRLIAGPRVVSFLVNPRLFTGNRAAVQSSGYRPMQDAAPYPGKGMTCHE